MGIRVVVGIVVLEDEVIVWQYGKEEALPIGPNVRKNVRAAAAAVQGELVAAQESLSAQIAAATEGLG